MADQILEKVRQLLEGQIVRSIVRDSNAISFVSHWPGL